MNERRINFGSFPGTPGPALMNFNSAHIHARHVQFKRRKAAWKAWATRRARQQQLPLFK